METKNAIGTIISSEYYSAIRAADCSDGHELFTLEFRGGYCDHIEEFIPVVKIRLKTHRKREGFWGDFSKWMIDAIDKKRLPINSEARIGWVIQYSKLPTCSARKVKFIKGSINILEKLADKGAKFHIKRRLDKSSFYNENEIQFNETIKVFLRHTDTRYNRRKDWFAIQCMKLGLDFDKYSAPNIADVSTENILRSICNDLGYNLLAII